MSEPGGALRAAGSRDLAAPSCWRGRGGSRGGSARQRRGRAGGGEGSPHGRFRERGSRVTAALLASVGLPREERLAGFSIRAPGTRARVQGAKLAGWGTLLRGRRRAAAASCFGRGDALFGHLGGCREVQLHSPGP